MGSATVQELRIEEAEAERKRIMESFGMSRPQVERLADADALTADEYQLLRRLRALDWLLES
jgi:predicted XRE-type DNA-binding protein